MHGTLGGEDTAEEIDFFGHHTAHEPNQVVERRHDGAADRCCANRLNDRLAEVGRLENPLDPRAAVIRRCRFARVFLVKSQFSTGDGLADLDMEARGQLPERVIMVKHEIDASNAEQLAQVLWNGEPVAPVTVVDLSTCRFMDSAGVRALIQGLRRLQDAGSEVRLLVASTGSVRLILELCVVCAQFPMIQIDAS